MGSFWPLNKYFCVQSLVQEFNCTESLSGSNFGGCSAIAHNMNIDMPTHTNTHTHGTPTPLSQSTMESWHVPKTLITYRQDTSRRITTNHDITKMSGFANWNSDTLFVHIFGSHAKSPRFSRQPWQQFAAVPGYDPKALGEVPLPHDWQDPNFNHRGGRALEPTGMIPREIEVDVTGAVGRRWGVFGIYTINNYHSLFISYACTV